MASSDDLALSRGPVAGGAAEFRVGGHERDALRPRALRHRDLEPAAREGERALVAARDHREISRIVELPIDVHAEHADRHLVLRHDDRHRRRDHIGGIGPEQQVDFVDAEQLGVDGRHVVAVALVVVIDELDRAAQDAALGVDVVAPDLEPEQQLLAVRRHPSGQRHAEPDLDRVGGARRGRGPRQRERGE
jgi:hypothetical protein